MLRNVAILIPREKNHSKKPVKVLGKDCGDWYRSLDPCQKLEDREDCRKGDSPCKDSVSSTSVVWKGGVVSALVLVP